MHKVSCERPWVTEAFSWIKYKEDRELVLHHERYTIKLLENFGMLDSKPTITPMDPNVKLHQFEARELEDATLCRTDIGSLIYLTLTRPDLAFCIGVLNRFMQKPRRTHLHAVKRVLRYVKVTIGLGISFKRETSLKLEGFCDVDYGGDPTSRRSTVGYVLCLVNGLFHGATSYNQQCPCRPLKPNTGHQLWLHKSAIG